MEFGLTGIGREKNWIVEIDSILETNFFGLEFSNQRFCIRIVGLTLDKIKEFHCILEVCKIKKHLQMQAAFGGRIEVVNIEGRIMIRIVDTSGKFGINMAEVVLEPEEFGSLAVALGQALTEAE